MIEPILIETIGNTSVGLFPLANGAYEIKAAGLYANRVYEKVKTDLHDAMNEFYYQVNLLWVDINGHDDD